MAGSYEGICEWRGQKKEGEGCSKIDGLAQCAKRSSNRNNLCSMVNFDTINDPAAGAGPLPPVPIVARLLANPPPVEPDPNVPGDVSLGFAMRDGFNKKQYFEATFDSIDGMYFLLGGTQDGLNGFQFQRANTDHYLIYKRVNGAENFIWYGTLDPSYFAAGGYASA